MPSPAECVRRPLPPYLASLYETPLLTREQERHLFRKFNYLKYRAASLREKLNPKRPQLRLMDDIERLYGEAVATKNQIIEANLHLVVSIMKRYVTDNDGTFELISDGNISLMRPSKSSTTLEDSGSARMRLGRSRGTTLEYLQIRSSTAFASRRATNRL